MALTRVDAYQPDADTDPLPEREHILVGPGAYGMANNSDRVYIEFVPSPALSEDRNTYLSREQARDLIEALAPYAANRASDRVALVGDCSELRCPPDPSEAYRRIRDAALAQDVERTVAAIRDETAGEMREAEQDEASGLPVVNVSVTLYPEGV